MQQKNVSLKEVWINLLIVILLCLVIGNLLSGMHGFLTKGSEYADDFTMRYRESKYLLNGINPFDIVLGEKTADPSVGSLWDVAGYTPWGMVFGAILNFTFLPETYARYAFCFLYVCVMLFTAYVCFQFYRKKYSSKMGFIAALLILAIPGWGTGLSWLNFGAIFGAMIFFSVLLLDDHEVLSGILLGLAATKPQLAAPFYLGLLLKKKYKALTPAVLIPLILWVISLLLTSTSPFYMIGQFSKVMDVIGGQLGNWITSLSVYYDLNFVNDKIQFIGMLSCILLGLYIWFIMKKNNIDDNLTFFSVPAILSGMWTYSQSHDRTVLIIVIMCLVMKIKKELFENKIGMLLLVFVGSCIIDIPRLTRVHSYFLAQGSSPSLVYDLLKYFIWIAILFFLAFYKTEGKQQAIL